MNPLRYPKTFLRKSRSIQNDIEKIIADIRQQSPKGLHLGCGTTKIPGLINCDLYVKNADMNVSATDLNTFENESVDLIEHHHMIEHLSFEEAKTGISEWARVLKKGGFLLITTYPNIHYVLIKCFMARRFWKYENIIKMIYGPQEHEGMFHKSAYDRRIN